MLMPRCLWCHGEFDPRYLHDCPAREPAPDPNVSAAPEQRSVVRLIGWIVSAVLLLALLNCIPAVVLWVFLVNASGRHGNFGFPSCWALALAGYVILGAFWLPVWLLGWRLQRIPPDPDEED